MSVNVCCRRLNSLSLSAVNCDDPVVVDNGGGGGGLFSISIFIFSLHSSFKSEFAAGFASVDDVDDDAEGGLPSKNRNITDSFKEVVFLF